MIMTHLQGIANTVVRRAQRQGYVIPRQVREELAGAGLADELWKDVIALAGPSLAYRRGRYHYVSVVSARREEEERHQRAIQRAVRQLIRNHQADGARSDRRQHPRVEFIQPVKVQTEDLREFTLLCRDISPAGLRLIGTRSLLGQKVRVTITQGEKAEPFRFLVRILWTCALGEDLFENGGTFLQTVEANEAEPLKVVS
jgi:hypothetical protein